MKGCDRTLSVFLKVIEERRCVARLHALEYRKMQFKSLFNAIKDAPDITRGWTTGNRFDIAIRRQIEIQLGSNALYNVGKLQS